MNEPTGMSAPFETGTALRNYFDTLPKGIQELVIQSGAKVQTEEDLRNLVQQFQGQKTE